MADEEITEVSEKARESGNKSVGITTAIVAVLLAVTTMLGHRSHTESVFLQTEANDQWAYYQAKNVRSHMYAAERAEGKFRGHPEEGSGDRERSQ